MALTLRTTKGFALTYAELDANFTELNTGINQGIACGRLSNKGGSDPFSECHFVPFNGNKILINGTHETIPDGTLASSGGVIGVYNNASINKVTGQTLAVSTLYYVYVYMLAGVMTMDFSTTVQALDSTYGVWVKTGDATCSLVGQLRTNAASQTLGNSQAQTITSFFNRVRLPIFANLGAATTASNTAVELDSTKRLEWVQWSDDAPRIFAHANLQNSVSGNRVTIGIGLNSATVINGIPGATQVPSALARSVSTTAHALNPGGDGYFFATLLGYETEDSGAGLLTVNDCFLIADPIPS